MKTQGTSQSPLSPTNPGSPLYPDGIMTPFWLKKHREAAPAIVVAFYELWSVLSKDPLSTIDRNSLMLEKESDSALIANILDRK